MKEVNGARIDTILVNLRFEKEKNSQQLQNSEESRLDIRNARRPSSKTRQADRIPGGGPTMYQGQPGRQEFWESRA